MERATKVGNVLAETKLRSLPSMQKTSSVATLVVEKLVFEICVHFSSNVYDGKAQYFAL